MASKTSPAKISAVERQAQALQLRKLGLSYDRIASECGFKTKSGAYAAVTAGLRGILREAGEELLALELERLDRLQMGLWEAAAAGKVESVDRVLKIMERRAKLLGLDAPTKVQADLTSKGAAVGPSLQVLMARMTTEELNALEPILARLAGEPSHDGRPAIEGAAPAA